MILRGSRFLLVAALMALAAFLTGLGSLLTGAPPASKPRALADRPGTAQHSGDDGGFSVTLTAPDEAYLVGIKRIVIEPTLPPGDSIVGVDFFVDGRLVATDRRAPYGTEFDFGQEIQRHTIIVTALTSEGRRAKVSFVSRAADLTGGGAMPLVLVPAVVRGPDGRFVDGLSLGDFVLMEDGAPRTIVHFDDDPAPQSIAVAIQAGAPAEARGALVRGALSFAESLPSFDSLALLPVAGPAGGTPPVRPEGGTPPARQAGGGAPAGAPVPEQETKGVEFSFDHALFAQRLTELDGDERRPGTPGFARALDQATRGLVGRPRGRVLLALLAGSEPQPHEGPILAAATGPESGPSAPEARPAPPEDETLRQALDEVKKAGATLHVVVFGGSDGPPFPALRKVVEETGGEFMEAATPAAVEAACRRISESLEHQYLVSFAPRSPDQEGWRSIELRPRASDLQVRFRRTYFTARPPVAKRP